MEEKIIDKETIQKERRVMENSLKEYFDYRGQVIKDNWNDEFVKYSSSFLRGPINGKQVISDNPKPDNYQFLIVDVFITKRDKEKIFVFTYYHLDDNKYELKTRISDDKFIKVKEAIEDMSFSVNRDILKHACIAYNNIYKQLEDYVKENLKCNNLDSVCPKLRGNEYGWHIDVLCKWKDRKEKNHLIIPLNIKYVPYIEKTFAPVEFDLFLKAINIQKGLIKNLYM